MTKITILHQNQWWLQYYSVINLHKFHFSIWITFFFLIRLPPKLSLTKCEHVCFPLHLLTYKHFAIRKINILFQRSVLTWANEVFFWNHSAYWKCQIHLGGLCNEYWDADLKSFILFYWPLDSIRKITFWGLSHMLMKAQQTLSILPEVLPNSTPQSIFGLGWVKSNQVQCHLPSVDSFLKNNLNMSPVWVFFFFLWFLLFCNHFTVAECSAETWIPCSFILCTSQWA